MGVRLTGRVGDAPVDHLRMAGELRADLADPVAQADHVPEPLPGERVQVLGPAPADVDAVLVHDQHRLRVQRLGLAARAGRLDRVPAELSEQRLGQLRAGAVPGAQEQHADARPDPIRGRRDQPQARVESPARLGQELGAAGQVDAVIGVPAVGRAAPGGHQPARLELAEVVGNQALRLAEQTGELADLPVAAPQLGQQLPAQRMSGQPQEPRRGLAWCFGHPPTIDQTRSIDQSHLFDLFGRGSAERSPPLQAIASHPGRANDMSASRAASSAGMSPTNSGGASV